MEIIFSDFAVSTLHFHSYIKQFSNSPYEMSRQTDVLWLVVGCVGTAFGLYLRKKKKSTLIEELDALEKNRIVPINRWAAGNYSKRSNRLSDYPFYSSFVIPCILLLDSTISAYYLQIVVLYIQSLAIAASMYTITNGLTDKFRPLVFRKTVPMEERLESNGRNSFFSGHVTITATAFTFTAKVFSDFHPNSSLLMYLWIVSLLVPAVVGYYRIHAGKHYPTDVVIGYIIGIIIGTFIPQIH